MPKKLKEEELSKISGGENYGATIQCLSPTCKKIFNANQLVFKKGNLYCPYCGAFYCEEVD